MGVVTPQQHAHAQALNEAHDLFGGRPLRLADNDAALLAARDRWIAARETQLTAPAAQTPVRSTT